MPCETRGLCLALSILLFTLLLKILRVSTPTIAEEDHFFPAEYNGKLKRLNALRTQQANKYIQKYGPSQERLYTFSVTVITGNRTGSYATQTLGYLLNSYAFQRRPFIDICNVEPRLSAEQERLAQYFPVFNVSNALSKSVKHKDARDYFSCLEHSSKHAQYSLILEDDVLAVPDFCKYITSVIRHLNSHRHIHYVKLYHPLEKRKLPTLPILLEISAIYALCALRIVGVSLQFKKAKKMLGVILFCLVLLKIALLLDGKQLVIDLRFALSGQTYITMVASGYTQAVLFRTSAIPKFVAYYNEGRFDEAKDSILDDSPFVGRMTDTNLAIHIGSHSSVTGKMVHLPDMARGFELSDMI